jgi:restriction system protein
MSKIMRVMLGKRSVHAAVCFAGGFIGTDFDFVNDLSACAGVAFRDFSRAHLPIFLAKHPGSSKIKAGLACGALWSVSFGLQKDDLVLCPDGERNYRVGKIRSSYYYAAGEVLQHRRKVEWLDVSIPRDSMSEALQNSSGSIGTVCELSDYRSEIDKLIALHSAQATTAIMVNDPIVENPTAFALEKHLETFLVQNWNRTELAQQYSIYEEDGEMVGQQYQTDAGAIDVLAISKDRKRILVLELKRGRASDVVVGQILRYMGFVKEQIAEADQIVEGLIIALEDDQKLRWALLAVPNIKFYRYEISFKLREA